MSGVFIFVTMIRYTLLLISTLLIGSYYALPGHAKKAPAGTEPVPNLPNRFLDKVEVTNIAWREYLFFQKNKFGQESEEFLNAIPDTAVWKLSYDVSFFSSHKYNDWPMVGISFEQAQQYAIWRSMVVSQKEKREITYFLPSLKVYKMASAKTSPNKMAEGLYSTSVGFRTFLGLCENAAEMTDKEGLAIMGSDREKCLDTISYVVPKHNLGFRCMATVK